MPLFMCAACGCVENTALTNYWHTQVNAHQLKQPHKPLCSQCDPDIGKWHGQFSRRLATDMKVAANGQLFPQEEIGKRIHYAPFKDVVLPPGAHV